MKPPPSTEVWHTLEQFFSARAKALARHKPCPSLCLAELQTTAIVIRGYIEALDELVFYDTLGQTSRRLQNSRHNN